MKIVIASNAYKGNMTSMEVANCIQQGISRVIDAQVVKLAVADGGDGTLDTLVAKDGKKIKTKVLDPLGREIDSFYGILDNNKGIIEMALASGLTLLQDNELNPMRTSTYGTGMLIKQLLDRGIEDIIIGIGGSATNDGGTGMAQALGVRFYDNMDRLLDMNGENLLRIARIDMSHIDTRAKNIMVASDVTNPLYGDKGAARVYAAQKGADECSIDLLDKGLRNLSKRVIECMGIDNSNLPGAGAAGGLGFGLVSFLGAKIDKGIDTILDAIGYDRHLEGADLVFTGEGRIDNQSQYGKVPAGVARRAKIKGVPVIAIAGSIGDVDELYDIGITAVISTAEGDCTLEYAIENAPRLIANASERVMRIMEAVR